MRIFSKADITVNALTFVGMVVVISIISVIALYKYIEGQTIATNQATCAIKFSNYCLEWAKTAYDPTNPPYDWDSKSPTGCENVKIYKPQNSKECIGVSQ
jgi:hypothetical protein